MTAITVRPDAKMAKELEKYAKLQARSKAYLLKEAWDEYVAIQEWEKQQVLTALAEEKQGQFTTPAEVARLHKKFGYQSKLA